MGVDLEGLEALAAKFDRFNTNLDYEAAKTLREAAAEVRRLREALHFDSLNASAIHACREACRRIMGDNATWVDDDVARTLLVLKRIIETNGIDLAAAVPKAVEEMKARAALQPSGSE